MHENRLWRGILFCGFSCPFVTISRCPSCAQGSLLFSRESPRSGVNVVGLRPSLIAQHSLRRCLKPIHTQREGRFSAISAGRSPGKTPSIRGDSRERKSRATKNTKMHEKLFWRFPYWWQRPLVAAAPAIPAPWRSWRAWRGTISRKGRKAREGKSWALPFLWLFVAIPSCPSPPEGVE